MDCRLGGFSRVELLVSVSSAGFQRENARARSHSHMPGMRAYASVCVCALSCDCVVACPWQYSTLGTRRRERLAQKFAHMALQWLPELGFTPRPVAPPMLPSACTLPRLSGWPPPHSCAAVPAPDSKWKLPAIGTGMPAPGGYSSAAVPALAVPGLGGNSMLPPIGTTMPAPGGCSSAAVPALAVPALGGNSMLPPIGTGMPAPGGNTSSPALSGSHSAGVE